jgi:hypothetical protein
MLLLFLVLVIVLIFRIDGFVIEGERFGCGALSGFVCGALGRVLLALAPMLFPGVEDHVQPRHHLLDRRQLPGRARLAARTGRSLWPCGTLRAGRALLARFTALALQSRFALRPRLALRAGLAAPAIRAAPAGMSLRSRPTLFAGPAAWARRARLSAPAGSIIGHCSTPK